MMTNTAPVSSMRVSRPRRIPGEEGTWIFLLGDMAVFAVFFGAYLNDRSQDPDLFNRSQETLTQFYGAVNTLVLLASSLLVVIGMRTITNPTGTTARWAFAGALACGLIFSVNKFLEYGEKVSHDLTPVTNDYFMWYYILTGLHFLHVILGMAMLVFLLVKAGQRRLTTKQYAFAEGGACFWHMVDLLWIVLWPLLYLVH